MNGWIHAKNRGNKMGQVEGRGKGTEGTERRIQSKQDKSGKEAQEAGERDPGSVAQRD